MMMMTEINIAKVLLKIRAFQSMRSHNNVASDSDYIVGHNRNQRLAIQILCQVFDKLNEP